MPLSQLLGQPTARQTLERALTEGMVHHAYRFEGPSGVGKTTAALLLAQALLCPEDKFGCGVCSSCQRVVALNSEAPHVPQHPDVLFVGRGMYPESMLGKAEATGISVEQIRRIVLGRLGFRPHEGRALVIVVHDADELTVSAANALLKTLEEPARDTYFILLTSRPGKLLDTVRSRSLALRFAPLAEDVVRELLVKSGAPPDLASLAQGSMARARALAEPETRQALDDFVQAGDAAVVAPYMDAALAFADGRPDKRDDLIEYLGYWALRCAERGRKADGADAPLWASRFFEVTRARSEIERNGSAALVLETLISRLRKLPRPEPTAS